MPVIYKLKWKRLVNVVMKEEKKSKFYFHKNVFIMKNIVSEDKT